MSEVSGSAAENRFAELLATWDSVARSAGLTDASLRSESTLQKQRLAGRIFERLFPLCKAFLSVVQGYAAGADIGYPGYERTMCFCSRFLQGNRQLDHCGDLRRQVDRILEDALLLGWLWHELDSGFPTREYYASVDFSDLMRRFTLDALVADASMRHYGARAPLYEAFFTEFYDHNCEGLLKGRLRVGWWRRKACRSFLHNIYLAGTMLGVKLDLATPESGQNSARA